MLTVSRTLVEEDAPGAGLPDTGAPASRAVTTAREYLHAHFSEPVRLARLADVCRTSPFHLVRNFTRMVGMPPHAYQMHLRANRAKELLMGGDSLTGVAYLCGFCDQSHLTRAFKKVFGVTPGAWMHALQHSSPSAAPGISERSDAPPR